MRTLVVKDITETVIVSQVLEYILKRRLAWEFLVIILRSLKGRIVIQNLHTAHYLTTEKEVQDYYSEYFIYYSTC
jgi:hypothetical protein